MLFGVRNVASFWGQLFIRTPGPRFWPASLMAMDNVLYACRLAEHKLQSGLNLRCNLVRAQTILSQHRLRFSGLSKAVASFPLAQPAQTRINTGLFKKSKDN